MRSGVVSSDLFCVHKSTYWNVERTQRNIDNFIVNVVKALTI